MMQGILMKKAYTYSVITHLLLVAIVALLVGHIAVKDKQELYVIDLDTYDSSQGSGHAGGGQSNGAPLFPDKLSTTAVQQKIAQASEMANDIRKTPTVDTSILSVTDQKDTSTPIAQQSSQNYANTKTSSSANSTGTAYGTDGQANGTGDGSSAGSGSGSAQGDGYGYGEGSGIGQGSGNSGAEGTGSAPFDADGLWSAINRHKQYPLIAVKRNITGSVTLQTTLDSAGNISGVEVIASSGSNILDQAAVKAAYAVGSYPNATGKTVVANTTVTFALN